MGPPAPRSEGRRADRRRVARPLRDRRVDLPGAAARRAGPGERRRRARGDRRSAPHAACRCFRAAPAARSAGRPSARRSSSTTASISTASSRSTPTRRTVTVEPGIVLDAAERLAAQARPVVPGRRQHVGAVHARRHGRQQLVRLALARLRQHGAQRRRDRCAARRRHRGAVRTRARHGRRAAARARRSSRALRVDRRARARRDRARRAEA